jgi:hypothetical protein
MSPTTHPPIGSCPAVVAEPFSDLPAARQGCHPERGTASALPRLVSRQSPGLAAGQAANEQRPLADRLHPPAIDIVDVAGLELGGEPVAGSSDKPGDPPLVADEHHDL